MGARLLTRITSGLLNYERWGERSVTSSLCLSAEHIIENYIGTVMKTCGGRKRDWTRFDSPQRFGGRAIHCPHEVRHRVSAKSCAGFDCVGVACRTQAATLVEPCSRAENCAGRNRITPSCMFGYSPQS